MSVPSSQAASRRSVGLPTLQTGIGHFMLARLLRGANAGSLVVVDASGRTIVQRGAQPGPDARIDVKSWRMLSRLISAGHVGFGEAYMAGDFETPDLCALLTWTMKNEPALRQIAQGSWPSRIASWLQHFSRSNTPSGSRRNISAHYDLGNDFYATWLDAGMSYSSALFTNPDQSLEDAQVAKLDRIAAMLAPERGDRVLEIGCGWGPLAERLAAKYGCRLTGLTLSSAQFDYAGKRLAAIDPPADLRLADYRSLDERFDQIVSVEMIEAVGERYWPLYFNTLRRCLRPGGRAVIQAITIDERAFEGYRANPDFIQKHIFPGGMLPTITLIRQHARTAGFTLGHAEHFGASYARTICEWRRRFQAAAPKLKLMGFDDEFHRKWDYYLAYCETGFQLGAVNVGLYTLEG